MESATSKRDNIASAKGTVRSAVPAILQQIYQCFENIVAFILY